MSAGLAIMFKQGSHFCELSSTKAFGECVYFRSQTFVNQRRLEAHRFLDKQVPWTAGKESGEQKKFSPNVKLMNGLGRYAWLNMPIDVGSRLEDFRHLSMKWNKGAQKGCSQQLHNKYKIHQNIACIFLYHFSKTCISYQAISPIKACGKKMAETYTGNSFGAICEQLIDLAA